MAPRGKPKKPEIMLSDFRKVKNFEDAMVLFARALTTYFRLSTKGIKNIPRKGPALFVPNHSGFAGFDVIVLAHHLHKILKRRPRILAHRGYFDLFAPIRQLSEDMGLRSAQVKTGIAELEAKEHLIVFPEGEKGNFKASRDMYDLQKFHSGFLRMAVTTGTKITPVLIIGAEESNLNLGNIDLGKYIKHLVIPMPLNVIPLPAKWTIEYLPAIDVSDFKIEDLENKELVAQRCEQIRTYMQDEMKARLKKRKTIFV